MKNLVLLGAILPIVTAAQNVGIGTTTPKARLHVADSSVVFTGSFATGNPPISGSGSRMMWYADKGAFRAGSVGGDNWDKNKTGLNSFASGFGTTASGNYSSAFGSASIASGEASTAIGYGASASGTRSFAVGEFAVAAGNNSTAIGAAQALGHQSVAVGSGAHASSLFSFSIGNNTLANAFSSLAMGTASAASNDYAVAIGYGVYSKTVGAFAAGLFNDTTDIINPLSPTDRIFQVGNGSSNTIRSNAITVLRNGNTGIGTLAPSARLHIKHNSYPVPSFLIEESEDDYTRMEFRNTTVNSFWQIIAKPKAAASDAKMEFWNQSGATTLTPLIISGNGNATLLGTLTQNSDARLKRNIQSIDNALEKISHLNGYTYNWKDTARDQQLQDGLMAQEVQQVLPELVAADDKGILSVNYSGLIPVLIEAIKEQQKQNEALQNQIDVLKFELKKKKP
jgi:hypothetical protein